METAVYLGNKHINKHTEKFKRKDERTSSEEGENES